ncbi:MAG: dihydroorotase family protein, partial [Candidatus Bathyarchaeia archaeon]
MLVDTKIVNAKILTVHGITSCGITIEDGKIHSIGLEASLPNASRSVDINGKVVLPGLIDVHVHLRDLDLSFKEDFHSGTCAAAAGGFTTVLDMPNTKPPTNSLLRLKEKIARAAGKILVNVGFYSDFPKAPEDFNYLKAEGAVAFKIHLLRPTTELNVDDDSVLRSAFKAVGKTKALVSVHAEDRSIITELESKFQASGDTSLAAFLEAHSPEAEVRAIERILRLIKGINVRVHFAHVSTLSGLKLIIQAKQAGLPITCEVTPHHLFLTEEDFLRLKGIALITPPLRTRQNALRLMAALKRGQVDLVVSDHAPHLLEEKMRENVWEISPGIPGLETTLPLLLTQFNCGHISLRRIIEVLSEKPAKVFGFKTKGRLKIGYDADLTIVDLTKKFTIDPSNFHSKAKYSPFNGWKVVGKPVQTWVGGNLVMDDGMIT